MGTSRPLGLPLIGDRLHGSSNGLLVPKVVVSDWRKRVIQVVNQWLAGRNVEFNDILVWHLVEIFDKSTQTIAMRHDDDAMAGSNDRGDCLHEPSDGVTS